GALRQPRPERLNGELRERARHREEERHLRRSPGGSDCLLRLPAACGEISHPGVCVAQLPPPTDEAYRVALCAVRAGEAETLLEEPDRLAIGSHGQRVRTRFFEVIDGFRSPPCDQIVVRKHPARRGEI